MTIYLCHGGVCESCIRCSWPSLPGKFFGSPAGGIFGGGLVVGGGWGILLDESCGSVVPCGGLCRSDLIHLPKGPADGPHRMELLGYVCPLRALRRQCYAFGCAMSHLPEADVLPKMCAARLLRATVFFSFSFGGCGQA